MTMIDDLPKPVVDLIAASSVAEFATISQAGVPIDTACLYFPSEDLQILGIGTGMAYPAKAERARRNPKVGLLVEGGPDEPVVSIAGMAAVRDSDLQANTIRYIAETAHTAVGADVPWELARTAVFYYSRMIVETTPARLLWWDNPAAMDGPPHRWEAPADTVYPTSDPKPPGAISATPAWKQASWREIADRAISRGAPAHLTLIDDEGFPLPIRAREARLTEQGFDIVAPRGAPWSGTGKATLSFQGLETFVGETRVEGGTLKLTVERALPLHPIVNDPSQLWEPTPETYEGLMGRLQQECERRGVPIPTLPEVKPEPTEGARRRMARLAVTPREEFVRPSAEAR